MPTSAGSTSVSGKRTAKNAKPLGSPTSKQKSFMGKTGGIKGGRNTTQGQKLRGHSRGMIR